MLPVEKKSIQIFIHFLGLQTPLSLSLSLFLSLSTNKKIEPSNQKQTIQKRKKKIPICAFADLLQFFEAIDASWTPWWVLLHIQLAWIYTEYKVDLGCIRTLCSELEFTPWLHRVVADHLSDRNAFIEKKLCFWFANHAYACDDEAEKDVGVVESVDDDENRNRGALSKGDDDVAIFTRLWSKSVRNTEFFFFYLLHRLVAKKVIEYRQ